MKQLIGKASLEATKPTDGIYYFNIWKGKYVKIG